MEECSIVRDRLQISLLTLGKFKGLNSLLFHLKSSANLWFSDDSRENLRNEILRQSLRY